MVNQENYGGLTLTQNQLDVLHEAVVKRESARITLRSAQKHYSSKDAAVNAMTSLQGKDVVDRDGEGKWVISQLPDELYQEWIEE